MKIAAVLATRKGSKRIKNKSIKKFGRYNLTTLKIQQILKAKVFDKFYFSSDIKNLNVYAKRRGAVLIKRPKKFLGKSTISNFAPFLAKSIKEDYICYLTNTSPLLNSKIIKTIINKFKTLNMNKYDSLSTFEECKEFLWNDEKSINYSIHNQPMSQNLKGIFKFVPAISIISKKKLLKYKNVIGEKPYKYLISKPVNIDIDTIYDYELAKLYKKNYLI